jgi:hypothetical protein
MDTTEIIPQRLQDLVLSSCGHVFDARTGRSYTLNPTGQVVLLLMQDKHPVGAIIDMVAERCKQHPAVVEAGVDAFVNQLGRYLQ